MAYDPATFQISHEAVMAVYVGDGGRRILASQSELIRSRTVQSTDVKINRGDGSIGDFVVTSQAVVNPDGWVTSFSGTIQDITERKNAERKLEKLAYYEPLTGLANRTLFHRELNDTLTRCKQTGSKAALLLFDLDRFKEVNDSLGHASGDELLAKVAQRLGTARSEHHFLARIGGDEFAIILSDYDSRDAVEQLAVDVRAAVSDPIKLERGEVNIDASVGIAIIPDDGETLTDIQRNADLALYQAKDDGRGRYRIFESKMNIAAQHKLGLARDLRRAINEVTELSVHYQPQVNLSTGQVTSFEALMRWTHPTLGVISPTEFIPIAESSHLICDLGRWILREAVVRAKFWLDSGEPEREVAVNVSAAQIWHTDFAREVAQVLKETGLPPHLLCLELTESLLADHAEGRVRAVLTELKQAGVTLALDDFGTNYSSLGYLTKLPFDKLKIDRVFLDGIVVSERARKLLGGVIALGRGLSMTVVIEGVETEEELAIVREFDCVLVQGYVFARPTEVRLALDFAHSLECPSNTSDDLALGCAVPGPRENAISVAA